MRNPISVIAKFLTKPSTKRSNQWPTVRKQWLSTNPACAACGGLDHIEVHHITPFHIDQTLELNPTNFITLCEKMGSECHLKFGHTLSGSSSWRLFNPHVVEDALFFRKFKPYPSL